MESIKNAYALWQGTLRPLETGLLKWFHPECTSQTNGYWPLINLPDALLVTIVYLTVICTLRAVMASRQPMKLTRCMQLYNITQVVLCAYMCLETLRQYHLLGYTLLCNNPNFTDATTGMSEVLWVFYLSKTLDFWDTIFIVLRKKDKQFTFLHLFHHTSIFLIFWMCAAVAYNGDVYMGVVANSFVHFVMYGYYFLSASFPHWNFWWKKYITKLQMAQFCLMLSQGVWLLTQCPQPGRNATGLYLAYITLMLCLFLHFDRRTYRKQKKKEQ